MYHYEYRADGSYITEYGVHTEAQRTHLGDGWYHAWNTFTTHPEANKGFCGLWHYEYYGRNKVSVAAVSIVPGSIIRPPLQFIDEGTTRTTSQGLLDLTGDSLLDLATVSFTSDGKLAFDGTDDRILLSNFTNKPINAITCEAWIKPTKSSISGTIRGGAISATNSMYIGIIDSTDGGNTFSMHWANQTTSSRVYNFNGQIPNNAWSHLVGTYDGSTARAYLNGVEIWSTPQTGTIPNADYYIGTYGQALTDGVHNFNGYIGSAKIYNRSLSADEVLQNYRHYKTRADL
jgi:hypothetical protein